VINLAIDGTEAALQHGERLAATLSSREQLTHDTLKLDFTFPDDSKSLGVPIGHHIILNAPVKSSFHFSPPILEGVDDGVPSTLRILLCGVFYPRDPPLAPSYFRVWRCDRVVAPQGRGGRGGGGTEEWGMR
jgi:hypothetical protein